MYSNIIKRRGLFRNQLLSRTLLSHATFYIDCSVILQKCRQGSIDNNQDENCHATSKDSFWQIDVTSLGKIDCSNLPGIYFANAC